MFQLQVEQFTTSSLDVAVNDVPASSRTSASTHHFVGARLPEKRTIQLVTETHLSDKQQLDPQSPQQVNGNATSKTLFRLEVPQSSFLNNGPLTAKVVEIVQNWFPVSRLTPEYKRQIEANFAEFEVAFQRGSHGDQGLTVGWSLDDEDHPEIQGDKARSFCILRGWDTFEHFVESAQTDDAKAAFPLLFQWQAPYKLVSYPNIWFRIEIILLT